MSALAVAAYVAAAVIGGLVVVAVVLLAVPVDLRGRAAGETSWSWTVQVRWLFGLVRIERSSGKVRDAGRRKAAAVKKPSEAKRPSRFPAWIRDRAVWRRAVKLMRSSLRGVTVRRLDADLTLGLTDPADTGRLFGALSPVMLLLRPRVPDIAIAPDFERAGLAGTAAGDVRVVPLRVLAPAAAFGVWLGLHLWSERWREP
jgi:hypothetical protein